MTAYVTHWITLGPEQYCKRSPVSETWAPDRGYKATILKKDCNSGETIFYSVRIDAYSPPERMAWFTIRDLEADPWPELPEAPNVVWNNARRLEITVTAKTLSGQLTERVSDHLTMVRVFTGAKPGTLPASR